MTADQAPPDKRRPPERLTHLSVSGFRSIRWLDLELGDLTVLVGANGAGKSNFVAFFHLLSSILSERLQQYVLARGGASSVLHYGPKLMGFIRAKLAFSGEKGTSSYRFSLGFAEPDRLVFWEEVLEFHPESGPGPFNRVINSGAVETNLKRYAAFDGEPELQAAARVFLKRLQDLRVYHFHDTSETAAIRLTQDIGDNRVLGRNGENLAAFLYMLQQSYPAHYDRILATVRLAVPYLQDLVLEPDPPNRTRIRLRWRDRSSDHEFGAHQLSDGSLRAIALITALLQPEELLPALIAIDEPELGLHPSAVQTVATLIQSVASKRQVVVATQSSRLIAAFAPEDVVVVERFEDESGRGESTFERLSRERLGDWVNDYDLGQLYDMNVTGGGPR